MEQIKMDLTTKLNADLDTFLQLPKAEFYCDDEHTVTGVFVSEKFRNELEATINKINNQKAYCVAQSMRKDKGNEFKVFIDDNFGSFHFNNYMNLIEKLDGDTALIFRFLYMCTYAKYDNYLYIGKYPMTEKDFKDVLKLSKNIITNVKKDMFKYNLLIKDEKGIRVNSKIHHRGHLTESFKTTSCRVFDEGVRILYENSKPSEHKKLGNIVSLIPYMNVHHNIISKNIYEDDIKKIKPLNLTEISKIIDYDYKTVKRLKDYLKSITVNKKPLIANISHSNADILVINPSVFYRGDNIDSLKEIIGYFELQNNNK